jgi:DnaJ-domain-containing protein 1
VPRPLKQLGVAQLEELFARSKTDSKVLKHLTHELQYRQVPRAVALLTEVEAAMSSAALATATSQPLASEEPTPQGLSTGQSDLWDRPLTASSISTTPAPTPRPPAATGSDAHSPAISNPQPRTVPTMTVDDACKVLGVAAGATWESIEQSRRLLVEQSRPGSVASIKREQTMEAARRVNAAYAVLSRLRTGRASEREG